MLTVTTTVSVGRELRLTVYEEFPESSLTVSGDDTTISAGLASTIFNVAGLTSKPDSVVTVKVTVLVSPRMLFVPTSALRVQSTEISPARIVCVCSLPGSSTKMNPAGTTKPSSVSVRRATGMFCATSFQIRHNQKFLSRPFIHLDSDSIQSWAPSRTTTCKRFGIASP